MADAPCLAMLRRILMTCSLALMASAGAASADHFRGNAGHGRVVRSEPARAEGGRWSGPVRYERGDGYQRRGAYDGRYDGRRYEGREHFGERGRFEGRRYIYPERRYVVREHYYNRWARPGLIVENYAPMDGYVWVHGDWQWNGYEWIWYPGHYELAY